ncbi:TLDC2, partial [Symbiodinium microadriaticum]
RRNPFSSKGVTLQRKKMGGLEGVTRLKLGESAKLPLNIGRKDKQPSPDMGEFAISKVSKIVDAPSASRLRMFLPESSNMEGFRLVFSTARDGWNLDTLYKRTSGMSPCIIILRSLQQHVIVGAYIPVPISPPSNSVRGNGTTFVFRLCGDTSASYRWDGEESSGVVNPLVGNLVSSRSSTRDQFVMCTEDCIMLGGSAEHGTNALRIDHELKTCASGPSDTYRNPPLAPEEFVQPFVIGELEVLCGMTSADLTMKQ